MGLNFKIYKNYGLALCVMSIQCHVIFAQANLANAPHDLHIDHPTKSILVFDTGGERTVKPLSTVIAPGDTSKVMSTLYKVNSFMEWYIKYFPIPYGSYSKETDLLFGLTQFRAFTWAGENPLDKKTQPSSISALGFYTLNRQYKLVLASNIMFPENKFLWKSDIAYVYYPLRYFGVGNTTSIRRERTLNTGSFQFSTSFLYNLWKKWYVGPLYDYYNYDKVAFAGDDVWRSINLLTDYFNSGVQSGLGMKILLEGRDNRLNAKKGWFIEGRYQWYDQALGSEYNYTYLRADARYYVTPKWNTTIATRIKTEAKNGRVPIQSLAFLGGSRSLRGIYYGRYRDNVSVSLETELRFPIYWIFGATVFGGIGQVGPEYETIRLDAFHPSYGAGLRLKVDSENDINLRFDIGFSPGQTIFMVNFAEAF